MSAATASPFGTKWRLSNGRTEQAGLKPQRRNHRPPVLLAIVMVGAGATTGAVHLGSLIAGGGQQLPKNPAELLVGLIKGTVTWPAPATWVLVGFGVLLVALAVLITQAVRKSASKRSALMQPPDTWPPPKT